MTSPWRSRRRRSPRTSLTLTSSTWSMMGAGGSASRSRLASSIAGGWPRQMGHPRGSSAEDQGDWGLFVDTWSASAPGCLCRIVLPFHVKMNSDPAVVSVLLPGVLVCESRSWRSVHSRHFSCLPSWWSHVEIGHYVTSWQFLFAVWVYSSWRNAWFNSGHMLCVSSWCFWKVFLCEGELVS